MDKMLREYAAKFGEQFPLMLCRGCDDADVKEIIEDCLKSGKPYEVDHGDY